MLREGGPVVRSHLRDTSRGGKFAETESSLTIASGWRGTWGGAAEVAKRVYGFSLGVTFTQLGDYTIKGIDWAPLNG